MPERTDVRVLVTGTGCFVGHHLVSYLRQRGYWVRGSDLKYPEYIPVDADEFQLRDSRHWDPCLLSTDGVDHVYAFAAGMGMGFISSNHAAILRNNALIAVHTLGAARLNGASRYLFSSSAVIELSDRPGITVDHVDGLQGVPGCNSDNKRPQKVLRLGPGHPARGRTAGDLPVARAAGQPPLSGPPMAIRTSTSSRSGSARLKW